MANNFITNNKHHKTLKGRLNTLISISDELKFLVGFFYFSGWKELYKSLTENENVQLKLLVGLQVDKHLSKMIVEHGNQEEDLSQDELFNNFTTSLGHAINNEEMDTEAFYNQVEFFLKMLESQRLIIRKTENPNHAKLYLFRLNEDQAHKQDMEGQFVTGSSNLTRAGLSGQEEFNVEIKDYGFTDAEHYFDELWNKALPITEDDGRRTFVIDFIRHRSQAAIVTPFEAYALILKTYLDLQQQKQLKPEVERILEEIGFKKFSYQLDAVNQALGIIEEYNGVIIADVVGLGKSVIAAMIAKNMGKRGMVICPPGLVGDKGLRTGWQGYIEDFKLYDWEVESRGRVEEIAETIQGRGIDLIIVDEAHYFRNQDTTAYEALLNICRDKQVILLTATPFNNSPSDIFSLLKLFLVPGKSGITIEDNLQGLFRAYNYRFKNLSFISKNYNSPSPEKLNKAEKKYVEYLGEELPIDITKVRHQTKRLADHIKSSINPVVIRRNRLDLKLDYEYQSEVGELSKIADPTELFYHLSVDQAEFYDRILSVYFGENEGAFTGAIYQPYSYESYVDDEDNLDEEGNRAFQQQRNLFHFMRRLLVKRFESSFGAFSKSIDRFLKVHKLVKEFIINSGGKYILDRKLIESIYTYDEDVIEEVLHNFSKELTKKKVPKNDKVYDVDKFVRKSDFINDIKKDIALFQKIQDEIAELDLVQNDPKRVEVFKKVMPVIEAGAKKRKIIIFSEFVDTVKHLETYFRDLIGNRLLVCDGKISKALAKHLNENFNAQHKGNKEDIFDVLITSDKLAEGFNLNRAGVIVNYDIPWNPTKVIQRVGRINRIGTKVFDELFIYNFFPSEVGADIVKSREIAAQKMFLIHNSLGEDSKIFDPEEVPSPAGLFNKMNENPDDDGELNIATIVRNKFMEIKSNHPDTIENISKLPTRVKSSKAYIGNEINVLRKKGLSIFAQKLEDYDQSSKDVISLLFEELLPLVECKYEEPRLNLSKHFWQGYETIKSFNPSHKAGNSGIALENNAHDNLKIALKIIDASEESLIQFIKVLIKDIKKYHTLSKRTVGRIGRKKISKSASEKVKKDFFDEIRWIRNRLGQNYLDELLKRVEKQELEVIIAVENQRESE